MELKETEQASEPSWKSRMRGMAKNFLCRAGYEPCIIEAREQYQKWLRDEDPDARNSSVPHGPHTFIFFPEIYALEYFLFISLNMLHYKVSKNKLYIFLITYHFYSNIITLFS